MSSQTAFWAARIAEIKAALELRGSATVTELAELTGQSGVTVLSCIEQAQRCGIALVLYRDGRVRWTNKVWGIGDASATHRA